MIPTTAMPSPITDAVTDEEKTLINDLLIGLYPRYENLVSDWTKAEDRYAEAIDACAPYAFNAAALEAFCAHLVADMNAIEDRHVAMSKYINQLHARIGLEPFTGGPVA